MSEHRRGERPGIATTQLAVARPILYLPFVHAPISAAILSVTTFSTPRLELRVAKRHD